MSATLIAKGLAAGHGDHILFSGLDLVVAPGDVIGLVGANGAGKSTLLRLLAGPRPPARAGGARGSGAVVPGWPTRGPPWTPPPPRSATARRAPTSGTRPPWNAGWPS